MCVTKETCYTQ